MKFSYEIRRGYSRLELKKKGFYCSLLLEKGIIELGFAVNVEGNEWLNGLVMIEEENCFMISGELRVCFSLALCSFELFSWEMSWEPGERKKKKSLEISFPDGCAPCNHYRRKVAALACPKWSISFGPFSRFISLLLLTLYVPPTFRRRIDPIRNELHYSSQGFIVMSNEFWRLKILILLYEPILNVSFFFGGC